MPLPSLLTLCASATGYPILLRLLNGPSPSPDCLSTSIKAISTLHSSLTTALALYILKQPEWRDPSLHAPSHLSRTSQTSIAGANGYPDDTHNPLIAARSEFANAITALEAGYLLQDSIAILREAHAHGGGKALDKTLLTHHVGIGTALLVLHYYIARGREAGVYVIVMFLLMNASTPVLNLRWYLGTVFARNRKGIGRTVMLLADLAFVVAFAAARVGLIWGILNEYGRYHGMGAWETYWKALRMPCKMGTGALWIANTGWWIVLVANLVGRSKKFTLGGQ